MKRTMFSLLVGFALAGFCHSANAAATLTLDDGVNPKIVVMDNIPPDGASSGGVVLAITNVGVWRVLIVSGATKPAFGTASSPVMDIGLQALSTGAGTLKVSFSDINYGLKNNGTATGVLTAQETGNLVSGAATVDFQVWGDSGNALGAQTSLLADAGPQDWPPVGNPFPGSLALSQPFSLTEVLVINVPGPAQLNVDASYQVTLDSTKGVAGCRVTGGSNKETNNFQSACITTTPPTFVSHGGQVGASLSDDTAWETNDPCIGGSWEHNRHLTASGLVGAFHAYGNGNERDFDSLLCACLPCPENPGAVG